jgi:hypothetical protein
MIITEPKALKQALTSIKRVTLKRDKRNQNNTLTKINVRPLSLPVTPCDDNGNKYINDAEIINAPYPGERAIHFNKASLLNAINAATSNDIIVLNMPESPLAPMYINGLSEYGDTMILPLRKVEDAFAG